MKIIAMIQSKANTKFFSSDEFNAVREYCKENGLIPFIYHETKDSKYKRFTKNMLTRRLKASGICFVDLIEKRSVTDWEVKQEIKFTNE